MEQLLKSFFVVVFYMIFDTLKSCLHWLFSTVQSNPLIRGYIRVLTEVAIITSIVLNFRFGRPEVC